MAIRILLAALIICAAHNSPAAEGPRPNVLWICADDHAAYVTGAYGNRQVRTPNLDRLASAGVQFDRAYCNSPVCTASRQSFLTGRYPRSVGVTLLQTPLPESELTVAETLKSAGYETISIGKMHFNSQLKHGFDVRVDSADAHAALKAKGAATVDSSIPVLPQWKPFKDPARIWLNSFTRPYAAVDADMPGTYFAQTAINELQKPRQAPWFMMVSFYEPHSPYHFPVEFRDRHKPGEFAAPHPGTEDDNQIPEVFRGLTDEEKQGIIASYYTSVEFMDKNVGLVLDAIEISGQAGNTLVIYNGDHGYMLGQHGRFEKHCSYEEAVRVPLMMKLPGEARSGTTCEAFVELIDVAPTILEVCGVAIPKQVQGMSLLPLLKEPTGKHRDHVIVEYAPNDEIMFRDEGWKFVYERGRRVRTDGYDPGRPLTGPTFRLCDLKEDPSELHNLAARPEQTERVAKYVSLLAEHLKRTAREKSGEGQGMLDSLSDAREILEVGVQPRDVAAKP